MAANTSKQQSELQALNSQLDSLKQQVSVAEQAETAAYAARDEAAKQYPVASLLQQKIAADKALLLDPNSPSLIAAQQKAATDFQTAKAAYAPYVDAADKATANTIATRSPYVDAQTKAGELEVAIVKADPTKADAYPDAAAYIKEQNTSPNQAPTTTTESSTTSASTSETTLKENPNLGTNPSGAPGPNTQVFDDGSTLQTFDDGSTLATATDGSTSSSPATDGTATGPSAAQAAVDAAQSKYDAALKSAVDAETALQQAQDALDVAQNANPADPQAVDDAQNQIDAAQRALENAQNDVSNADKELTDAQAALDNPSGGESVTNKSSTDLSGGIGSMDSLSALKNRAGSALSAIGGYASSGLSALGRGIGLGGSSSSRGPLNSMPSKPVAAVAGFGSSQDMRVKLRIPSNYLVGPAAGPNGALSQLGGILWPYTPQISITNAASYAQNKVTHSNYQFYNYQSSSVGPISVSGKFTAQNEYEAAIILSVQHVLRALTKMKFGDDSNAGAPPPICRLDAFGDYQFKNIPCAIADFKVELPDGVDYIAVGRAPNLQGWGNTMVPTSCTISVTLNIMYSRQEMMNYGVDKWLAGQLAGKGYL